MSGITDFNIIDDCDKIDSAMINAFVDFHLDEDNLTGLCLEASWGSSCLDLTDVVKGAETCTHLSLSPEDEPNCLVYNGECEDFRIHGDDLSRIISMKFLKDVDQNTPPSDGDVYMYDGTSKKFETYDLQTAISNLNTAIQNINARLNNSEGQINNLGDSITNIENRLTELEAKLTPPTDAPNNVSVVFGNINTYSDPNVVINESTGAIVSLDKTHGLYTHTLASGAYGDEIFG